MIWAVMSNRSRVCNYSTILGERVEGLLALFRELQTLRRRLRAAQARTIASTSRTPKARRRRVLRRR